MSRQVVVPALGESVVEATVGEWSVKEGDAVKTGDILVRLETDKVDLEVSAEQDGVVARILRQKGEDVKVGDPLAELDAAGAEAAGAQPPPAEAVADQAVPRSQGEGGEQTTGGQSLPPSQAAAAAPAPGESDGDGRISPLARRIAEERGVDVSRVQGTGPGGRVTREDVEKFAADQQPVATPHPSTPLRSAQDAQQARPLQGSAQDAQPAQPAPLRSAQDAQQSQDATARPVQPVASASPRPPMPEPQRQASQPSTKHPERSGAESKDAAVTPTRPEQRIRFSRRRQTIARRLVEAQQTAAMLTTFNEIDMSAVMAMRTKHKETFKERFGVGLGFMSFFVKASIGALKAIPQVNAELQGDELVLKQYYDIGIAIGAEDGLVVPVVRDADRLTFAQIEKAIEAYAKKAKDNTLTLDDLRGGTFTITNGGVYGSLMSTPILNPPQVGILGMHKIEQRPMAVNGEVVIRPMMYVALSYDHRVIDGREAVQFLVKVKQLIEDPEALLLEG